MNGLFDTHTFLWWVTDDVQLSATARAFIEEPGNDLYLSAASVWEIAIKAQLGKLPLPREPAQFVREQLADNAFMELPVLITHALHTYSLARHHKDPFDRILVAQCHVEGMVLLTGDSEITQYGVPVVW